MAPEAAPQDVKQGETGRTELVPGEVQEEAHPPLRMRGQVLAWGSWAQGLGYSGLQNKFPEQVYATVIAVNSAQGQEKDCWTWNRSRTVTGSSSGGAHRGYL